MSKVGRHVLIFGFRYRGPIGLVQAFPGFAYRVESRLKLESGGMSDMIEIVFSGFWARKFFCIC